MAQRNREAWLNQMAELLRPWFRQHGYPVHGRMTVTTAVLERDRKGICLHMLYNDADRQAEYERTGIRHIFVSGYEDMHKDDIDKVGTLMHEMLHAILPVDVGHKEAWQSGATALGLDLVKSKRRGLLTQTISPDLRAYLTPLVDHLGPLPKYDLILPPVKLPVRRVAPVTVHRFQCPDCKIAVEIKPYSLTKAGGGPPCWNIDCAHYEMPMNDVTK